MKTLSQAEIEEQARRDYRRLYFREPDISAENDHGSLTLRETLERQIEERMERLRANVVSRHEHRSRVHAAEQARTEARQQEEQAAIEADLRRQYDRAMPKPVTDAEWEQVKDAVLHKYRLKQMEQTDALIKQTAQRYRI